MKKGSRMTEEQRRRNREIQKKVWTNHELRKKHGQIHKGQIAWNKGISPSKVTIEKQKATYQRTLLANPEIREKMSLSHKGKKRSEEAIKKLLKLNEYGLFEIKTGKRIAGKTEKEIYDKLGVKMLNPEKRVGEVFDKTNKRNK